jgi:hypothetical protein
MIEQAHAAPAAATNAAARVKPMMIALFLA